jgi:hypothetical protein
MAQALIGQLFIGGVWTSYPVYSAEGVEVEVGPDADTGTKPNKITLTWNNDSLAMDPYRVDGALYGLIGRNTKTRVQVSAATLSTCEATVWDPDRTVEHAPGTNRGRSWTSFEAEGLLCRLALWEDPIESPLTRHLSSIANLLGLWPLEGGNSDTKRLSQIATTVAGATPGQVSGTVTMAGDDGPGGGDKTVVLNAGGMLQGRFARHTTSGWQLLFHAKLAAVPASATYLPLFRQRLSNANTVEWQINDTTYRIVVTAPDGTTVLMSTAVGRGGITVTDWVRHRLKFTVSGATVTVEPAWYAQDDPVIFGTSGTYAANHTGALLTWDVIQNAHNLGASYSHILGTSNTVIDLTTDLNAVRSFNGYLGELAAERYSRLMIEEGLTGYVGGTAGDSMPMGRQKPGVFLELLEECMRTEDGLIYDEPTDVGLMFRMRTNILDQTVKLALTRGVDIAPPLKRVTGYSGAVNYVVVENYDASTATAVKATGALSTAAPPAGIGTYKKTLQVNMANSDMLDDRASWELAKGTTDAPRYQQLVIDLLANPSLAATVTALRPGDLITVAGAEPDLVRLHVLRIVHKVGAKTRTATLSCRSAAAWVFGKYDATAARYDSGSTTTAATSTTTATALAVTTSWASETWSTTGVPYDIKAAGERMTVTACTAAAGAGPFTQTMTVTRSVNGVVKAHVAGESVSLAEPIYYVYW